MTPSPKRLPSSSAALAALVFTAGAALAACATEPTLRFLDDGALAGDAGVDATVGGDDDASPPAADAGVNADATASAETGVDDGAAPIDDASDDGPLAIGLCPNANPPPGLTCCNAIPCIGSNCAAKCNQCEKRCGTATFCCADLAPLKCALRAKGCAP